MSSVPRELGRLGRLGIVVTLPVALWLSFICRSYNGDIIVALTEVTRLVISVIPLPSNRLCVCGKNPVSVFKNEALPDDGEHTVASGFVPSDSIALIDRQRSIDHDRLTKFNAATDSAYHTWRRSCGGYSPPPPWSHARIVPLVLRRVGNRTRQLWRGFGQRDLTSHPRLVPAWEVFQTSRRRRGKTSTAGPRSSADRGACDGGPRDRDPCVDHAKLYLVSSCLFPANRGNESSCTSTLLVLVFSASEAMLLPYPPPSGFQCFHLALREG